VAGSVEWATETRRELLDEIRTLSARGRGRSHANEAIGLVPEGDHLQDLKRRLAQVERLIEAMSEAQPSAETGWPGDLGDPGIMSDAESDVGTGEVRRTT
jgi:hypothetical protein